MFIESIVLKLLGSFVAKTALGSVLGKILGAFEMYSIIDAVTDLIDCASCASDSEEVVRCIAPVAALQLGTNPADYRLWRDGVGSSTPYRSSRSHREAYAYSSLLEAVKIPSYEPPKPDYTRFVKSIDILRYVPPKPDYTRLLKSIDTPRYEPPKPDYTRLLRSIDIPRYEPAKPDYSQLFKLASA